MFKKIFFIATCFFLFENSIASIPFKNEISKNSNKDILRINTDADMKEEKGSSEAAATVGSFTEEVTKGLKLSARITAAVIGTGVGLFAGITGLSWIAGAGIVMWHATKESRSRLFTKANLVKMIFKK
ncbi:hypothetical protein IPH25_00570 [bacterium]|nr:MAG: hypothetical protein IPG37_02690 [bacterium]QQR61927.1 MAG: hypothetical protein IPH25_00570 [bacterium]QQR62482.1 MAG: hypothetical protein IPH67_03610 [bacterium]